MTATDGQRRYGGKSATQRRTERRERLLDTGLDLFGTRGYSATSIELLCNTAGLNARYFYEEFDGREGLLQAIYDRHVESVFGAVVAAVSAAEPTPRARLTGGLAAFVQGSLADPRAARINYFEMVGVSSTLEQRRREVLRLYSDLAAAQLNDLLGPDARIPGGDARTAGIALVSSADGLIIDLLSRLDGNPPDQPALDHIVTALTDIFAAALDA